MGIRVDRCIMNLSFTVCKTSFPALQDTLQVNICHIQQSWLIIIRLLKKKVGREFFISVASDVGLDHLITRKSESAESFDSFTFLDSHTDRSGTWWKRTAVTESADSLSSNILEGSY